MNEYKYVKQLTETNPMFDKYEQYMDLKECYDALKKKENNGFIDTGICNIKLSPGITVVAGMTGHGKSMLGNSIAYRALKSGLNVAYITLEISKENMFYQMISLRSFSEEPEQNYISHSTIKKRELLPKQEELVFDKIWPEFKQMSGQLYVITEWDFDTTDSVALENKLMEVEDYAKSHTSKGIDLIIVDYIQLFKQYKQLNLTGEYNIITNWVNDFRKMSLNYLGQNKEIPIVLLSQLNRDAFNDFKKKMDRDMKNQTIYKYNNDNPYLPNKKIVPEHEVVLSLSQIAGCVEIAKAANQIITIYADEELKASKNCWIQVLKNRDGETKLEPRNEYMNPVYYCVGSNIDMSKSECLGNYDSIIATGDTVDFNELLRKTDPFAEHERI